MDHSRTVAMSDLTAGTRIRHLAWDTTGTVRVSGEGLVSVKWDGSFVEDEISDEGVVYPAHIEVIPDGVS